MAEIVLIHGIAQEQETADSLESRWIPALAGGIRTAGHADLADKIWPVDRSHGIEVRMAAFGDLFLAEGAMGSGEDLEDLNPEQLSVAEELAAEWLQRAATRESHPDHETAVRELGYLNSDHEVMGLKEDIGRSIIHAAARLPWFALGAVAVAERSVMKSLSQVTKYMTDSSLRKQIHERVRPHVGPETRVIIGHSLGSVVAYDIATRMGEALPLLLTLGSPLGLRNVIYDRLDPQPPTYPAMVRRWVNVADLNDLIAAEPDLTALFNRAKPAEALFECGWIVENGAKPHQGEYYLGKREVGQPIAESLMR